MQQHLIEQAIAPLETLAARFGRVIAHLHRANSSIPVPASPHLRRDAGLIDELSSSQGAEAREAAMQMLRSI